MTNLLYGLLYASLAAAATCINVEPPKHVTVCQIKSDPEAFLGQTLVLDALYESDRRHFSHLTDNACGTDKNTIMVGLNSSQSAQGLWLIWEAKCKERGSEGMCIVKTDVRVSGQVRRDEDGLFFDVASMETR